MGTTSDTCAYCGASVARSLGQLVPTSPTGKACCGRGACRARAMLDFTRPALEAQQAAAHLARERSRAEREAVLLAEIERHRAEHARALGLAPEALPTERMPYNERDVAPLEEERRAAFVGRLGALVREARGAPQDAPRVRDDAAVPSPPDVVAASCSGCRGRCCRAGGVHAYLDAHVIRTWAARETDEELVAAYLAHLPDESVVGSCVYHGARGCTLPRERRADICNRHLCDSLKELVRQRAGRPGAHVLALFVHDDRVHGVHRFPPLAPGTEP